MSLPRKYFAQRVRRTRLQSALLAKVLKGIIQLKKRLISLENLDSGGVRLVFEDGTVTTADLVVGGDGIRSVRYRRLHYYFNSEYQARLLESTHSLDIPSNLLVCPSYSPISLAISESSLGTTIWRVLIPLSSISHIPNISTSTAWWHGPSGHVYFSLVDDPSEKAPDEQMFEIAGRNVIDPSTLTEKRFSWGIPATNQRVESHFKVYPSNPLS